MGVRHQPEHSGRERQPEGEDREPLKLVTEQVPRSADPEAEAAVRGGVRNRGEQKRDQVGLHRAGEPAQAEVERGVREGRQHPDHEEHRHLQAEAARAGLGGHPPEAYADLAQREPAPGETAAQAYDAPQVVEGRPDDVDPAVRVVDPVDRDLVDPQPGALGDGEQLGVEEPLVVAHQRQQLPRRVATDRLEPALRVGEPDAERPPQDEVVAARDQLALEAALDSGRAGQPRPDREVRVSADQRCDQRQQRVEVGGEVDVHVDQHVAVRPTPGLLQRAPPPLLGQVLDTHLGVLVAQASGDHRGPVGRRVVGDRDPEGPRQPFECLEDPAYRGGELLLLVVDGDHDVEDRSSLRGRGPGRLGDHRRRHATPPDRS